MRRGRVDFLERSEMSRLLGTCDLATFTGRRDLALYLLLSSTGIRLEEALALDADDVGASGAHVGGDSDGVVVRLGHAPRLQDALRLWEDCRETWCPRDRLGRYFVEADGEALGEATVRRALRARSWRARISRVATPEMLRNSFALELVRTGYTLDEIRHVLRADGRSMRVFSALARETAG